MTWINVLRRTTSALAGVLGWASVKSVFADGAQDSEGEVSFVEKDELEKCVKRA